MLFLLLMPENSIDY